MKLPRVHRVKRGKKVHCYHRKTRARLPDLPEDHPDFIAAWSREESRGGKYRRSTSAPGTLAALIEAFRGSPEFRGLSKDYGRVIAVNLGAIAEIGGEFRAETVKPEHIQQNLRPLTPHQADARLKAWRALFRWGVREGYVTADPAALAKRKPLPKSDGHRPWTAQEIADYRDQHPHGTRERIAFEVVFWTGARIGDVVKLGPQHIDGDGWITFTQDKTGGTVSIPASRELPENLEGLAEDQAHFLRATDGAEMLFLKSSLGTGWTKESFGQWFSKTAPDGRSAHGLRKSRAISIAEAGGTTHQIAAWTGHESLKEVERYSKAADKKRALSNKSGTKAVNTARKGCKQ